jgi:hypothetical protein
MYKYTVKIFMYLLLNIYIQLVFFFLKKIKKNIYIYIYYVKISLVPIKIKLDPLLMFLRILIINPNSIPARKIFCSKKTTSFSTF